MDTSEDKQDACAASAAAPESTTAVDKVEMEMEIDQILEFLADGAKDGLLPLAEEAEEEVDVAQKTNGATRKVSQGYWEKFCDRVQQGKIEPRCIIDFAYTDAGYLNLAGNVQLFMRAYCFVDTCDPEREWRQLVVHVHTLSKWVETTSIHPQERVKERITSVNVRHANKVDVNGSYKQENGEQSYGVVPVSSDLRRNWRQLFKDGNFSQMQWGTDPLNLPKGEDQHNFRVKGIYTQLQKVIKLGESLFKSHPVAQAWTTADNISHFNNQLTNAPLNRTPLRLSRASLEFEIVAFRKKIDMSTTAAGAGAGDGSQGGETGMKSTNEPDWKSMSDAQLPALPHCILFVGANNLHESQLSLEKEVNQMEASFTKKRGGGYWDHRVTFRSRFYAGIGELVQGLRDFDPVILHFACHGRKSVLQLFEESLSVDDFVVAIQAWCNDGDKKLRLIVANACHTSRLAQALSEHVDFVIGHDTPVQDEHAVKFAENLYGGLGNGDSLYLSFTMAKLVSKPYCMLGRKNARNFRLLCGKHSLDEDRLALGENKQTSVPKRDTHEDGKRGREGEHLDEGSKVQPRLHDQYGSSKQPLSTSAGVAADRARTNHDAVSSSSAKRHKSALLGKRGDAGEGLSSGAPLKSQRSDLSASGGSSSEATRQRLDSGHQLDADGHVGGEGALIGGDIFATADSDTNSVRGVFPYDVFISHTWDKDDEGRDNHARATRLNARLQGLGFKTWFDNEQMRGNILQSVTKGIEGSAVILICVTRRYMEKVKEDADNHCKFEFEYALTKRTTLNMLPIVMEASMTNTSYWDGTLCMTLGRHLYYKLASDLDLEFEVAVKDIAVTIRRMMEPQQVFENEQQDAARQMSSRSQSPASSVASGMDTVPVSPRSSSPGHEVVAMYVDSPVSRFREDMREFMQSFLQADDQPVPRKWKLCELLLVAFMRDKVAASCDEVIAENLDAWQGWCEDPEENLTDAFHKLMHSLKPPVFEELKYDFAKSDKQNHTSLFVIDWMVRHSAWALPQVKRDEWAEKVVLQWFNSKNIDSCDCLLERAETFLQKCVKGTSWGAKILGKVIQTNSYVVFFRMGALSSLLMREHCALGKRRHAHKQMEVDCRSELMPLLSMSLLVSSSQWHLWLAEAKGPSAAHISDIFWRLQRIACLPRELLEANEYSLSKIEFVEWEPLYTLVPSKSKDKSGGEGGDGNDDFGGGVEEGGGGGGTGSAASGGRGKISARKEVSLKNLFEKKLVLSKYLTELGNDVGFFHDAASGEKMRVEEESISLKAVSSESGASRCEADPKARQQDMLCPINLTIMDHPVKCFDGTTYHTYERSAIEKVFEIAQQNGNVAISPLTKRELQKEQINGKLHLVLQPDEEMRTKIEALREETSTREARQKHEAEGEEERKMMCSRMGYDVGDFAAEDSDKCRAIDSAEELLAKLSKGDFICVIGPPASGKTLTMFQVSPAD